MMLHGFINQSNKESESDSDSQAQSDFKVSVCNPVLVAPYSNVSLLVHPKSTSNTFQSGMVENFSILDDRRSVSNELSYSICKPNYCILRKICLTAGELTGCEDWGF